MGRDRNERGRYADRIPPEWVLELFENREDQARPLTASDIMDELGCSRRTAHNKLGELVDRGDLETRKVGAKGRVWWVPMIDTDEEETPDFRAGFGALAGSDFAEQVATASDEFDRDFRESEREVFADDGDDGSADA
jgi:predicted ArsR family transcriptional regulator